MVYGVLSQPYTTNHTVYIVFQGIHCVGTFDLYGCHGTMIVMCCTHNAISNVLLRQLDELLITHTVTGFRVRSTDNNETHNRSDYIVHVISSL